MRETNQVRVDALTTGQRFRCVSGRLWVYIRRHGAHSGAYIAHDDSGREDCFAGCAIVTLLGSGDGTA